MTTSTIWNANGTKSGTTLTLTNLNHNGSIPPQGFARYSGHFAS